LVGQRALGWPALLLRGRRRAQDGPDCGPEGRMPGGVPPRPTTSCPRPRTR